MCLLGLMEPRSSATATPSFRFGLKATPHPSTSPALPCGLASGTRADGGTCSGWGRKGVPSPAPGQRPCWAALRGPPSRWTARPSSASGSQPLSARRSAVCSDPHTFGGTGGGSPLLVRTTTCRLVDTKDKCLRQFYTPPPASFCLLPQLAPPHGARAHPLEAALVAPHPALLLDILNKLDVSLMWQCTSPDRGGSHRAGCTGRPPLEARGRPPN